MEFREKSNTPRVTGRLQTVKRIQKLVLNNLQFPEGVVSAVSDIIYTPPSKGIGISLGWEGSVR